MTRLSYYGASIGYCLLTFCSISIAQDFIPDHERTPGAINQHVTQANIEHTVCVPGWTSKIRPPTAYTNKMKARQMRELNLPGKAKDYEEDHLVPLCVGGHPTDHRNLWPEPREGQWAAKFKDQLETSVCRAICRGALTLEEGQAIFLTPDWTKEYENFFQLQ
ncbi:MAG TPA: hypothetical protein VHB46_12865 [Burkholderiales bacterium]|nr:hypothetical protein [Burkholderiales bacterium]